LFHLLTTHTNTILCYLNNNSSKSQLPLISFYGRNSSHGGGWNFLLQFFLNHYQIIYHAYKYYPDTISSINNHSIVKFTSCIFQLKCIISQDKLKPRLNQNFSPLKHKKFEGKRCSKQVFSSSNCFLPTCHFILSKTSRSLQLLVQIPLKLSFDPLLTLI